MNKPKYFEALSSDKKIDCMCDSCGPGVYEITGSRDSYVALDQVQDMDVFQTKLASAGLKIKAVLANCSKCGKPKTNEK